MIEVNLTQEDIDKAIEDRRAAISLSFVCPIAKALQRTLGNPSIAWGYTTGSGEGHSYNVVEEDQSTVLDVVFNFDRGLYDKLFPATVHFVEMGEMTHI